MLWRQLIVAYDIVCCMCPLGITSASRVQDNTNQEDQAKEECSTWLCERIADMRLRIETLEADAEEMDMQRQSDRCALACCVLQATLYGCTSLCVRVPAWTARGMLAPVKECVHPSLGASLTL